MFNEMNEVKLTEILAGLSSVVIAFGIVLLVVLFGKQLGLIELLQKFYCLSLFCR